MNNQLENDADRRAYEALLARNAWGKTNVEAELGAAVLEARRRTGVHGGILEARELVERLREPTAIRARELYRQMIMKLITKQ